MTRMRLAVTALWLLLAAAACATEPPAPPPLPTVVPTPLPTATRLSLATPVVSERSETTMESGDAPPPEIIATAEALFGEGGVYVASLPRPSDVPSGWLMDRAPRFDSREPQPGETYRFACEDLMARSIGVASVGYRSLEGLPSASVEYVVYPSEAEAKDALADMRQAAAGCGEFGAAAAGGVQARMTPIAFRNYGAGSFAVALETSAEATGDLLTHVIKIQQGNVVIGINHVVQAGDAAPDSAVSERLSRLAVSYVSQIE